MEISKRLKECARLVPLQAVVADIGTDHALLPIYLVKNNLATKVIASDVRKGPIEQAKKNVLLYRLNDSIEIILSDGIEDITDQVDTVIISGMGGKLISDILKANKLKNVQTLILQSNVASDILRKHLETINYKIVDELIFVENSKTYEIIKAVKGNDKLTYKEIKFGPFLLKDKNADFINKWTIEVNKLAKILKKVPIEHVNYQKIIAEIKLIEEILNES